MYLDALGLKQKQNPKTIKARVSQPVFILSNTRIGPLVSPSLLQRFELHKYTPTLLGQS